MNAIRPHALSDDAQQEVPKTRREWIALARTVVQGLDPEVVDLSCWRRLPLVPPGAWSALRGCGTVACAAGHLANHPTFRAAGLHYDGVSPVVVAGSEYRGAAAMAYVMGLAIEEANWLFGPPDETSLVVDQRAIFIERCDSWLSGKIEFF